MYPISPSCLNDRSVAFYLFLCVALLWPFVLAACFLCALSMWAGSFFAQRPKDIWGCLFPVVRIDWIEPDTPQPSVCCFSYPLSDSFKTTPLRSIYCCCNDLSLMLRLPSPLMLLDSEIVRRRCRFFCPFSTCLVRFGRSNSSSSAFFLPFCCCTITRFSRFFFFLYYLGFRFTCYRCILC